MKITDRLNDIEIKLERLTTEMLYIKAILKGIAILVIAELGVTGATIL